MSVLKKDLRHTRRKMKYTSIQQAAQILNNKLNGNKEDQKMFKHFSKCSSTDEERFTLGAKYLKKYNIELETSFNLVEPMKSSKTAKSLRKAGNKHFHTDPHQAVQLFCRSIANTPYPTSGEDSSEDLAWGFARRAALYYSLTNYDAALKDIDQALTYQYPQERKFKLQEMAANCLFSLGRITDACVRTMEALLLVPEAGFLTPTQAQIVRIALLQVMHNLVPVPPPDSDHTPPATKVDQHPSIPAAADCLKVEALPTFGRSVIATRTIQPGECLILETPYAFSIHPSRYLTHCYHCCLRSDAMIPCHVCNYAMFCTEQCRVKAWESYHSIECRLNPVLRDLDDKKASVLLPLRLLLSACSGEAEGINGLYYRVQELVAEEKEQDDRGVVRGFDPSGRYSADYRQVHHLHRAVPSSIWTLNMVRVYCLLSVLEALPGFFDNRSSRRVKRSTLRHFTGGLLLRLVEAVDSNKFQMMDVIVWTPDLRLEYSTVGFAVYLTSSLLNHACYPNAGVFYQQGNVQAVRALRLIEPGEQIFVCYALHHTKHTYEKRQEILAKIGFQCTCEACAGKWPIYVKLHGANRLRLVCRLCSRPCVTLRGGRTCECRSCHEVYNLDHVVANTLGRKSNLEDRILDFAMGDSTENIIPDLAHYVKLLKSSLFSPSRLIVQFEEYIRLCATLEGNISRRRTVAVEGERDA